MSRKRAREWADLSPYTGCGADEAIGWQPLAVGWLRVGVDFVTGKVPALFPSLLLPFCHPPYTLCHTPVPQPCPLCRQPISAFGQGEIRIIGAEEIFAAPDLIYHYITVHQYCPPQPFIQAILQNPNPTSAEYRALRKALQSHR